MYNIKQKTLYTNYLFYPKCQNMQKYAQKMKTVILITTLRNVFSARFAYGMNNQNKYANAYTNPRIR